MFPQLQELEGKLAEEIKCRDRAERKLKKTIKKLESIRVLRGNRQMEIPSSSVSSSSSQCFSGPVNADVGRCGLQDVEMRPCSLGSEDLIRDDDASGSSMGESARDDNKLALVPVAVGEQLVDTKDNVQGVLLALRNAKEQLIQTIRIKSADFYSSRDYFAYQRIKLP